MYECWCNCVDYGPSLGPHSLLITPASALLVVVICLNKYVSVKVTMIQCRYSSESVLLSASSRSLNVQHNCPFYFILLFASPTRGHPSGIAALFTSPHLIMGIICSNSFLCHSISSKQPWSPTIYITYTTIFVLIFLSERKSFFHPT